MKVISAVRELQKQISILHPARVGFVPTMGALHKGHITLVGNALMQCPLVIVSIFVNPTQFNDKTDLDNYPRTLGSDLALLGKVLRENDIVFTPGNREIYPFRDDREFHFGNLDNVMEACHRPGHFNGVAQVVSRFFEIIKPDVAFFGIKDFQQLAVIKELVRQTGNNIVISEVPIVREPDGLAMSSRNLLLEPQIREKASIIYKTLSRASAMINNHEIAEIRSFVEDSISKTEGFSVEYFEIVDDKELIPVSIRQEMVNNKRYFGCIAVMTGKIRLIDNIEMGLL